MADSIAVGGTAGKQNADGRTPAQWFCTLVGPILILAGILGFLADATFDTGGSPDGKGGNAGGALQGDSFLGLEVNGWHNVVHILSGLFLVAMAKKRSTAKTGVLVFAAIYAIVSLIGLINGNDVLGIFPINPADNILHILLTLGALLAGLASDAKDHVVGHGGTTGASTGERTRTADVASGATARTTTERATTDRTATDRGSEEGRTLRPEDHDRTRGDR